MTKPVVLVVDDEPYNRDLLRRVLFREYEVLEACDADSAIAILVERVVDVIVCDHVMPGRSGAELAREVHRTFPRTAALLLTGYEDAPEIGEARRDGIVLDVLGKPWAPARLRSAIADAVRYARGIP
jgi:response regulator RpfG family c-di-GMP phosphodiesterase